MLQSTTVVPQVPSNIEYNTYKGLVELRTHLGPQNFGQSACKAKNVQSNA